MESSLGLYYKTLLILFENPPYYCSNRNGTHLAHCKIAWLEQISKGSLKLFTLLKRNEEKRNEVKRNEVKRNKTDMNNLSRSNSVLLQDRSYDKIAALTVVFKSIKNEFPEAVFDKHTTTVIFRKHTDSNLTLFTIGIVGDKLSLRYNLDGVIKPAPQDFLPDNEIIERLEKLIMQLGFYLSLEFYEEQKEIQWKHEIFSPYTKCK